jgi:hypothetical protein
MDFRSSAGRAVNIELSGQTIGDDVVDNMQAEPSAAALAARREERIEGLAADVSAHAAAIVGKQDFDFVAARRPHLDVDRASLTVRKRVHDRIEKKVSYTNGRYF